MKKIIVLLIIGISLLNASCQNSSFISHFPKIKNDSIFDTRENMNNYYYIFKDRVLPESVALKYFFNNDTSKMQTIFESYNMDENKYSYTRYTKKVCPLYKKRFENIYLLCYGIESVIYISFYNPENDKILNTLKISDFSDELGNIVMHSTIFPNNYIVTTQINNNVIYKLFKIDFDKLKFKELKKNTIEENNESQNKQFDNAYKLLGITKSGELME